MGETKKAAPDEQPQDKNVPNSANAIIPQSSSERLKLTDNYINLIPNELKQRNQWVLWRLEERNNKPTKIPYTTIRKHASSTDADTWTSFDSVLDFYKRSNGYFNGIGYVFSSDDPFTGVDLDKCVIEGKLSDEAKAIMTELSSYTERSQSKTGIHIIIKGEIPGERKRTGNIEMYDSGRFFCVTGDHILHTPETIEERQQELEALYKRVFDKPKQQKKRSSDESTDLTDDEIISIAVKARNGSKFSVLYSGDDSSYGSQSEAELALCNLLAFYTKDPEQIDRIVRRSGLYREKWDREDYSATTIGKALSDVSEHYGTDRKRSNVIPLPAAARVQPSTPMPVFRNTDTGNAKRLVFNHGDVIRHCENFGSWYIWDGKRWSKDETGEIVRRAKNTVDSMFLHGMTLPDEQRAPLMKHAMSSDSKQRIFSMIKLAESEPGVAILPSEMDRNQWLINCMNGVIDLATGELLPHKQEYLMTKLVQVDYHEDAKCPNWLKFLETIMKDEDGNVKHDLIEFLQKAIGYSMTGDISEQVIFFLYGSGRNGKSTFMNTIIDLLGDYADQSNSETFMVKKNDNRINNDIADLKGRRLVAATESEEGKRLAESLIKQLSGGEPMKARFLHQNNFTFKPEFKLFFVTNHKPVIRGTDKGIWRRIRLIPFTVTIPDDEVDRKLPDKLKEELPGILRWMVEGCLKWQKEGLGIPGDVESATAEYQEEMDAMSHFIEEYCVINPQAKVNAKSLYPIYTAWCDETGEYAVTKIKLMMKLREWMDSRGNSFKEVKTNSFRGWAGLGLRSEYPDLSDTVTQSDTEKAIINNHSNNNQNHDNHVTMRHNVTESTAGQKEVAAWLQPNAKEEGEL